jgi:hypothetical protein
MNPPDQRPALRTRVDALPHPSGGKGFAYSQDMREFSMHLYHNDLLEFYLFLSMQTIRRYVALENRLGHFRPCRQTGNKRVTVPRDHNIVFLILYGIAYPKCSAAQINAYLYRVNYGDVLFRFYTKSQISKAERRIGLTRKHGSTTTYQAFLPIDLLEYAIPVGNCRY